MAYSEIKKQKHLERASKFQGQRINGKEYVTKAVAVQMAEMSRKTFVSRCERYGIVPITDENGRSYYDRQKLLDEIAEGHFGRYTSYTKH